MPSGVELIQCDNKECRVAETGKCVEGFALEKCPHFSRNATSSEQTAVPAVAAEIASAPRGLSLPAGDCLPVANASIVLRSSRSRVLAVIGPTSSGKTSLIASLYHSFLVPRTNNLRFARSHTLPAFEQAVHDARAASRRPEPDSETTPHSTLPFGVSFYHIRLQDSSDKGNLDLIIADRNGGEYEEAADDPTMSAKFVEVRRADCLTLLVDGKRLLDPGARHNCRTEIEMVLQALIDADATSKTQHVLLVLTKLDKVRGESQETAQKTERNFEAFVVKIQGLFGRFFRGISSLKVAASPHSSVLPYGYGVADLLDIWTAPVAINEVADPVQQTRVRAMERFIEFE